MPERIAAITLTDTELAELASLVTPDEFEAWTRQALGEYIERLTELKAQEQARAFVTEAVAAAKENFPSAFPTDTGAGAVADVATEA